MNIDLNSPMTLAIGIAAIIVILAGLAIFIVVTGPKKAKKTAILYSSWQERLGLPALTKNASLNSKAIEKFFKVVWPKKYPEELDVRHELLQLTQAMAVEFTDEANELFQPKKSKQILIYDFDDAGEGYLRLFSVEKDSEEHKLHMLEQKILTLLKTGTQINEFTNVDIPDETDLDDYSSMPSFIVTESDFPRDDEDSVTRVLELLGSEFSGVWLANEIGEDAILFRRQTEEDLRAEDSIPMEVNPFQERLEAREEAERTRIEEEENARLQREEAWQRAEEERRAQELAARQAAVEAGEISRFINDPTAFLNSEIEIAADAADLLSLDDEPEILKVDGLDSPILFCVYSEVLLDEEQNKVEIFANELIESLQRNLGGAWTVEYADESMTFRKSL